jgi:hypothetical protein
MLFLACSHRQNTASALLAAMAQRYGEIPTMHFTAVSMTEEVFNDTTTGIEIQGNMDFSRPDQFKLEWQSAKATFTGSIFQSHDDVHLIIGAQQPRQFTSLTDALESAAAVSGELSCFVPELLVGKTNRLNFVNVTMNPDVQIDGSPCYCIAGTNAKGSYLEFAIDKKSLLIRQIDEKFVITKKAMAKLVQSGQPVPDIGDIKMNRTLTFKDLGTNL